MRPTRTHILVAVLLFISACAISTTSRFGHGGHRDDYLRGAQAQLTDLDQHINNLKAQADRAQGNAKAALNADIDQLRGKQAIAQQRVAQIQAASEDSWQSLQSGADAALNDLKNSYDQAAAQFNK